MTVLMQASAASLVLAFTAAESGMISIEAAAAVVSGANVGTTVTALIAAIGATPNAKRAASAHVLFNVITGAVALLLLPLLIVLLGLLRELLQLDPAPAAFLALFHTVFNLLGVALMWPLAGHLGRFLERRFRTAEEDEARPKHLDTNVLSVATLALDALHQEVRRMGGIALRALRDATGGEAADKLERERQIVLSLNHAIADFVMRLSRTEMSTENAQRLPDILRIARYYETLAELAVDLAATMRETDTPVPVEAGRFAAQAQALLDTTEPAHGDLDRVKLGEALQALEAHYQELKSWLLATGARGDMTVTEMDARLRAASMLRRATEQSVKAALMLGK
jgi:phosphate:Na+ symporter